MFSCSPKNKLRINKIDKLKYLIIVNMEVKFSKGTAKGKKWKAEFFENGKKIKTTQFGSAGMSDYTKHKNADRKKNYLSRHKTTENWNDFKSAGSLSRYILWNKKTLSGSIKDYIKRFKLKLKK
tara:strand:- start:1487 stop:1858 length:372 start_codon:yes stop_codon:yes gene_type:complete